MSGGEAVIMAPQHCGLYNDGMGTLCNVHYDIKDSDFSKVGPSGKWLGFGASGGSPTAPLYQSSDNSLDGYQAVISKHYNGFEKVKGESLMSHTQ